MQDRTIDNALLALRKQIIRADGEGLEHVEALLAIRGVDMPAVLPAKRKDVARRGQMRRIISDALRGEGMRFAQLSEHVASKRPELSPEAAYHRTSVALNKMRVAGLIRREGRVWRVAASFS